MLYPRTGHQIKAGTSRSGFFYVFFALVMAADSPLSAKIARPYA
ncbi:hypothetical protein ETA_20630 [Erwinia tasmaniensis Et1/99]|uniref:Uncharacterized protein n=1 Tax=Erwinia tasmaniensis (strain DSM 17950 / CFBP 7177 / CIP 109463 / NCPPB 4357 / Et1/99) TaxID=465817 RepID=B2VDH3_ERWT9|nr:hypothetical protein ETA_20630 [Erwinia tasmaniensis Et1/99]